MGNYNESDYTEFRWIKKLKEEKVEFNAESFSIYTPIPLSQASSIERDLLRYIKTK